MVGKNLIFLSLLLFILRLSTTLSKSAESTERNFSINFDRNEFQKDGKPFRYISGTIHYFRIPADYWEDRLIRLRSMGANALETYIMWNLHEPREGIYDFSENLNFTRFILTAQKLGFVVILRLGPYADAEQDLVMAQIENEYGSYGSDMTYKIWLKNLTQSLLGPENVVYFTTDGNSVGYLQGGVIPGVYLTVDFGPSSNPKDVANSFIAQRHYAPKVMRSRVFLNEPKERTIRNIITTMEAMWAMNASFNIYISAGGTNWGYQAGAEYYNDYVSVTTSYDFRAPISEHGGLTPKYFAIRQCIERVTKEGPRMKSLIFVKRGY